MWLVLCHSNDVSALWAYQGLKACGLTPLELISAEMLAYSLRWEHWLRTDEVSINFTLANGLTIRSEAVRGVLNRLLSLPSEHLHMVSQADRDYAIQEFTAFFISWLYALPAPVLNQPTSQGLSGQWRHPSEWVWLATKAGLPTPNYRQSSREPIGGMGANNRLVPIGTPVNTVFVVKGHVIGPGAPPDILRGCQQLAALARIGLLGVEFASGSAGPWTFVGATPLPDLHLGGQALLDTLASVMQDQTRNCR